MYMPHNLINCTQGITAVIYTFCRSIKNIDFNNLKNQVGVFLNPKKVFIDTDLLKSLPIRELKSGFAEVIKHCLIKDKNEFYRLLNTNWKNYSWR